MKFRHLEKVQVRSGYYRDYKGIITDFEKVIDDTTLPPVEVIIYNVKLVITKDPLKEEIKHFKESELVKRWF